MTMNAEQRQIVTIDEVEYNVADLSEQQVAMVQHVADLEQKIAGAKFQLDQLTVCRESFLGMLRQSLQTEPQDGMQIVRADS